MSQETPQLIGAEAVVAALGRWPSFHDAEIVRLHLERDAVSTISIQLVGQTVGESGRVVTFTMERINDVSLDGEDINSQNVIAGVEVEQTEKGIRLTFSPCYGLAGRVTAERVTVAVDSN